MSGTGSRAYIWKQDPSVTSVGIRMAYVHSEIADGPRDNDIEILGLPKVVGDKNNDFLYNPKKDSKSFDGVHTFVVIRQVMTMYQRALRRMGHSKPFTWQWGEGPIQVYPHAGEQPNAYYSRAERCLKFYYFQPDGGGPMVYTNRSFDVAAHEAGHAVLDAIRPKYWDSWHPQTAALHESFGDLTAILAMLSQLDMCEAIICRSKGNLHAKTFFSAVAEEFGEALYGHRLGLRNADNNLTLEQVSEQVHDLSQVFTGAFYDILADMFDAMRDPNMHDDADVLFRVGEHMCELLVESLILGPDKNATFADIVNKMLSVESNSKYKKFIRKHFEIRGIIGWNRVKPSKKPIDMGLKKCHCTLSTKEHMDAVENAIKKKNARFSFG